MFKTPDGNGCDFFYAAEKNETASVRAGRSIFDKVLKMKIFGPGSKDSEPHVDVTRWLHDGRVKNYTGETKGDNGQLQRGLWIDIMAPQLKAWESKTGVGSDLVGTPLEQWPAIDVAMAANLHAAGVHSVEALAGVPDSRLDVLGMNGRGLRDRAKVFLEAAAGAAPAERLAAENAAKDEKIAQLEQKINDLAALMTPGASAPTELPKRGPGRPPKAAEAA